MLQNALAQLAADRDNALARTIELLSIPSISTNPAHTDDVKRASRWVVEHLRGSGFAADAHETAGHPIVMATRHDAGPNAPHILFYGHYDVQPPEPLELWESPPFKPVIKNGAIVARGAADDKGQICAFMEALRAWHKVSPKLPVNVTVVIEGEEECGGKNLPPFIHQHKDALAKANIILISDTSLWRRDTPSITYSLRGLLYFDIQLHNSNRDLHSGTYGGTLANPNTIMTQVLGKLFDDNHRVTIPGFYTDVVPLGDDERKQWASLGFDDLRDYLTPIGVNTPFGEAGFSTLERRWSRPACDINGLYGGYGGPGAKTVIPAFCGAKVSFRLAPGQSHVKIAAAFEQWLRSHNTHGCTWKITNLGGCDAVLTNRQSNYVAAAKRSLLQTAGKEPVLVRDGATIPIVGDFKRVLGLDSLLVGFGLEDDRIHSPNEKFELYCFDLACKTHTTMLAEFAR